MNMTSINAFGFKSGSCCSTATAAASSARICHPMDTAVILVVSICIVSLLDVGVRLCAV